MEERVLMLLLLFVFQVSMPSMDYIKAEKKIVGMYQLMKDVDEVFRSHNITYWAAGGTLLGAVRHGGICPLDIDLDLFIDESQESQFLSLKRVFERLGYKFVRKRAFVYKIVNPEQSIHCDIIVSYRDNDLIFYSCPRLQKRYRRDDLPLYFKKDELFPLKEYSFGLITIIGPNKPYPYLVGAYGKHCLKKAEVLIDNRNNYPALPVGPLRDNIYE